MYNIDKRFRVPVEEISCPGCGRKYRHHNTKVDMISSECSSCVKDMDYTYIELVKADYFISTVLGYKIF